MPRRTARALGVANGQSALIRSLAEGVEAGCDEAGRGCLAGPVFAAAVCLPVGFSHPLVRDSKQLSPTAREQARALIERCAIAWRVCRVDPRVIDAINILQASVLAMQMAVDELPIRPDLVLVDGNYFRPFGGYTYRCEVKGDGRFLSVAAASILAKTHRDAFMERLAAEYPGYGWSQNKGYPTAAHQRAIAERGVTPWHRLSFGRGGILCSGAGD